MATATFIIVGLVLWLVFAQNTYTVYADGTTVSVQGNYTTVQEVVSAAGLRIAEQDEISPHLEATADPEITISIQRAQLVSVQTEEGRRDYWTYKQNLGSFLQEIALFPDATDQIFADGRQITVRQIPSATIPSTLEVGTFFTVTIMDGEIQRIIRTDKNTVGEAIVDAGLTIYAADFTDPPLGSWLQPDTIIRIERSKSYTIEADGKVIQTRSAQNKATAVLAEMGVGLIGYDYTIPDDGTPLQEGDVIQVIRVTESFETIDEQIPFESLLQPTDEFELDQRGLLQAGVPGINRTRIRVRHENGVRVSATADGTWIAKEPTPEIIGYGTRVVIRTINTPEGPVEYYRHLTFRVTAYMAQTSGKPADHPGYGITASGVVAGYGVVAVDPTVVPFRSNVYVPGYGVAFVGDTGGGVKGRWIDLGYEDDWDTFVHWSGYTDVYYLTPVPEDIKYLLPTVLP